MSGNKILTCCTFEQNFAAQYDGSKGPDPGPGPMVSA